LQPDLAETPHHRGPMQVSTLPAARCIPDDEGSYTTSEVAASITAEVSDLLPELDWNLATLAGCADLTPAAAAVAAEILAAARRVAELARLLEVVAR
jgi:hypothetical protein